MLFKVEYSGAYKLLLQKEITLNFNWFIIIDFLVKLIVLAIVKFD